MTRLCCDREFSIAIDLDGATEGFCRDRVFSVMTDLSNSQKKKKKEKKKTLGIKGVTEGHQKNHIHLCIHIL